MCSSDLGLAAGEWLRRHPLVVGAAATVAVLLRPRRMLRLAGRGLVLWRTLRSVQTFLRQLRVAP